MGLTTTVRYSSELTEATQTEVMDNILIMGDANAYEIVVDVYREGNPVSLAGSTVYGYGMLPGNTSVVVEGSCAGNTARFTMSEEFFRKKGTVTVTMLIENGDIRYSVFRGVYQVQKSIYDSEISGSGTFPIDALMQAARNEQERINAELERKANYADMMEVFLTAKEIMNATPVVTTIEREEGHCATSAGIAYNPYAADQQILAKISLLTSRTGEVEDLAGSLKNAVETLSDSVDGKLNSNVGIENAGKVLEVNKNGDIVPAKSNVTDNQMDSIYPVGSIVQLYSDDNPSMLFGGTWIEEEPSIVLMSAGSDGDYGQNGGSASVMINTDNLPNGVW